MKRNKRTRKGQKETAEIIPLYQTRKTDLKRNTLKSCISKANIVHKLFTETNLSPELEEELLNL